MSFKAEELADQATGERGIYSSEVGGSDPRAAALRSRGFRAVLWRFRVGVSMPYLFIDGGYLDREIQNMAKEVCADEVPMLNYTVPMFAHFGKTFYFHCSDPENAKASEERFEALQMIPRWHVIL